MVELLGRNWGWVALRGVVAILFGLLALFYPQKTLAVLVLLFGIYVMMDGAFMVVSALARRHGERPWVALLLGGVVAIGVGIVTLRLPGLTATALLMLIAIWAILIGLVEIVMAIRLRKVMRGEWLFVLAGLAAVAFGVLMIARPAVGALAILLWIGVYAVFSGILLLAFGFRLRRWARDHPAGPEPAALPV
ncbi:MAG TPA: HdeD family acid-resistance protein [Longimicrobiales bacterium]|nr:HdeD family acid-resistance protein [Longimicrobiales bacterium]